MQALQVFYQTNLRFPPWYSKAKRIGSRAKNSVFSLHSSFAEEPVISYGFLGGFFRKIRLQFLYRQCYNIGDFSRTTEID
jgi:hypothetical protein